MSAYIKRSVRALTAYRPGEQPADLKVIKLNTNENPYPPSVGVCQALRRLSREALRRYPDPLSRSLRQTIASLHGCALDQVFVGNGSDEILALCTRAFVEDRGTIGYFSPSYSLYPTLAAIRAVATRPLELGRRFEWQMPAGYRSSLFFLTNPNAPTGLLYPQAVVRAFAARFRGVLVVDEAYADFAEEHCMDLALRFQHVLVLRSLSKAYSLAGLRVGYAVGSADLIGALFKIKDSYNLGRVAQAVAQAALSDQATMRANVAKVKRTRQGLAAALRRRGFEVLPSSTNFLWVKPPGISAAALYLQLHAQKILVRHFPGRRTGAYLRISVGTAAQSAVLLATLSKMCAAP